jgi:hypothetical protein
MGKFFNICLIFIKLYFRLARMSTKNFLPCQQILAQFKRFMVKNDRLEMRFPDYSECHTLLVLSQFGAIFGHRPYAVISTLMCIAGVNCDIFDLIIFTLGPDF